MKYPYISTTMNNLLFYAKDTATLIGDESNQFSHGFKLTVDESKCENNTHEYLSNTWGVVESKEHAEFIIELAEGCGFEQRTGLEKAYPCYFCLDEDEIYFFSQKHNAISDGEKQITIPLPPKDKEWVPVVGDEVTWGVEAYNGVIKAVDSDLAWIKNDFGAYVTEHIDKLKKPKSKQEILIKELQTKLCNNNAVDNYILACDIINGEIEGLNYEG